MSKRNRIIYWVATALMAFGMSGSGILQILHIDDMNEIFVHLGYPLYLMYIVGVWKILGVIVILIPNYGLIKEWAYAGFFFLMSGALISHLFMGDEGSAIFAPLFQLTFISLSWYFRPANRRINIAKD